MRTRAFDDGLGRTAVEPLRARRDLFRDVPVLVRTLAIAAAGVGAGVAFFVPNRGPLGSTALFVYLIAMDAYVAVAFSTEQRRKAGVTSKRLMFAAAGTWLFAAVGDT